MTSTGPRFPAGAKPGRWILMGIASFLCAVALGAQTSREYDLKAVFLYNFVTFVEWPKEARPAAGKPLIIGVLGRDPFGPVLDQVVAGEAPEAHPLEVRRYRNPEAVGECHILFISDSEVARLPQILARLRGKPVLTVADAPRAVDAGVIMTFATDKRIQLQVNAAAAQEAGLAISSKLLRVAKIVGVTTPP